MRFWAAAAMNESDARFVGGGKSAPRRGQLMYWLLTPARRRRMGSARVYMIVSEKMRERIV